MCDLEPINGYNCPHIFSGHILFVDVSSILSLVGKSLQFLKNDCNMVDALEQYDPHTPTWEWGVFEPFFTVPFESWKYRGRFDHICYSKTTLRCTGGVVSRNRGESDHWPCTAVFEFC